MIKKLISVKEASNILKNFNEILEECKDATECIIRQTKGEEGVIKLTKKETPIKYIVRIDFIYLNNKIFLGVTK